MSRVVDAAARAGRLLLAVFVMATVSTVSTVSTVQQVQERAGQKQQGWNRTEEVRLVFLPEEEDGDGGKHARAQPEPFSGRSRGTASWLDCVHQRHYQKQAVCHPPGGDGLAEQRWQCSG